MCWATSFDCDHARQGVGSHIQSGVLTCESVRVLIASNPVGDSGGSRGDVFTADKAWWFITLLTIGYLVNRAFP
jgi:hypothetical protein